MSTEKVDARIPDEVREAIDRYRDALLDDGAANREALERAIERAMLLARAAAFESCHHPETAREIRAQAAALREEKG